MSIRLLVADDHEVIRTGLASLLAGSEIEIVAEAATGQETLKMAEETRPDVILLDTRMPDEDGLSTLGKLRARSPGSRVVMLSTYNNPTHIARAVALGASDYVLKGSTRETLIEAITLAAQGAAPLVSAVEDHTMNKVNLLLGLLGANLLATLLVLVLLVALLIKQNVPQEEMTAPRPRSVAAQAESTEAEPAKTESTKVKLTKTQPTKTEPIKVELAESQSAKLESGKSEPIKSEAAKAEPNPEEQAAKNITAAKSGVHALASVVTRYHVEHNELPKTLEDLDPAASTASDPWGRHYRYQATGNKFKLWSVGPDGQDGTADDVTPFSIMQKPYFQILDNKLFPSN